MDMSNTRLLKKKALGLNYDWLDFFSLYNSLLFCFFLLW